MSRALDIVLRFSSLGDIVLCAAFVEKLAHLNSSEDRSRQIIFATQKSFRDIIGTFSKPPQSIWGLTPSSVSIFFETLQLMRAEHSREEISEMRIFDLHGVPKSFFLRLAARSFALRHRIPLRVFQTKKKSFWRWLTLFLHRDLLGERFIYQEHQKLLSGDKNFLPQLAKRQTDFNQGVVPILVAPDSQHWKKKWPVNYWEKFFQLALKELPRAEFTLVGGKNIFPQDLLDQLQESFGERFKNRLGQLPLSDLSRIASTHKLTLCGNSAWQHISEAVGVPVISMPGPIVKGFGFSPFMTKSRELDVALTCRPCTRHGGGNCHLVGDAFHSCMKLITPEMLIQHTKEMLK